MTIADLVDQRLDEIIIVVALGAAAWAGVRFFRGRPG